MKKRGVSRVRNRLVIGLIIVFLILFLSGAMIQSSLLMSVSLAPFVIASILLITTNRCPNCGEGFRGVYWSKEAGFCSKCGKKIYFDDEIKE